MEVTQASTPALYQILPRHITHREYDQSNVLMEGKRVISVLDFEFCGPVGILDLAYALTKWPEGF
jgi:Ser/Thr protein kinase RdoA (MazF antagonist)